MQLQVKSFVYNIFINPYAIILHIEMIYLLIFLFILLWTFSVHYITYYFIYSLFYIYFLLMFNSYSQFNQPLLLDAKEILVPFRYAFIVFFLKNTLNTLYLKFYISIDYKLGRLADHLLIWLFCQLPKSLKYK